MSVENSSNMYDEITKIETLFSAGFFALWVMMCMDDVKKKWSPHPASLSILTAWIVSTASSVERIINHKTIS